MAHQLPQQIEIFKAGRHTDDAGQVHHFSPTDVAGMAASYNPALREAPLTVGHPAHNLPAYGWVKGLSTNASGALVMNTHQVQPQFAEMVQAKLFKKRSASFYPPEHTNNPTPGKWYLRHVAFLGAQPPAIAGLADFASSDAGAVCFSEDAPDADTDRVPVPVVNPVINPATHQEQIRMTQELKDQLACAQAQIAASQAQLATADAARVQAETAASTLGAQLAQFAEAAQRERVAGFTSFCEGQVKTGILAPKDQASAVAVLCMAAAAADAKPVSFAEGGTTKSVDPVDFIKGLMARAKPVVSFGEQATTTLTGTQTTQGMSDAELDQHIKTYARKHAVSYGEAMDAVVATFTA